MVQLHAQLQVLQESCTVLSPVGQESATHVYQSGATILNGIEDQLSHTVYPPAPHSQTNSEVSGLSVKGTSHYCVLIRHKASLESQYTHLIPFQRWFKMHALSWGKKVKVEGPRDHSRLLLEFTCLYYIPRIVTDGSFR